jgi:hypothetical protein
MPKMLAYTIQSSLYSNTVPSLTIGYGDGATYMQPTNPQDDSYWICIINARNPREKVKDWVVPGSSNSTVPPGIETYMNDPDYLFAITTQYLSTANVPQGPFYDFFAEFGAGRELQKLEQLNTVIGCGAYGFISYILTGQCGPRDSKMPSPPSYEVGSYLDNSVLMMMSLMSQAGGGPPWSICDAYTFSIGGS